jgi:hypothetical protein
MQNAGMALNSPEMDELCDGVTHELVKNVGELAKMHQHQSTECARMLADSPLGLAQRRALLGAMKDKTDLISKEKQSNNKRPMQTAYRFQNFLTTSDWIILKDPTQPETSRHAVLCLRALRCGLHVGT